MTLSIFLFTNLLLYSQPVQQTSLCTPNHLPAEQWQALWIKQHATYHIADSLLFEDRPAPIFRRKFSVHPGIRKATLHITAWAIMRLTSIRRKSETSTLTRAGRIIASKFITVPSI